MSLITQKKQTSDDKKKYMSQYNRKYKSRTVNIGAMILHWRVIREENGCLNDPEVAKLLIECYYESKGKSVNFSVPPVPLTNAFLDQNFQGSINESEPTNPEKVLNSLEGNSAKHNFNSFNGILDESEEALAAGVDVKQRCEDEEQDKRVDADHQLSSQSDQELDDKDLTVKMLQNVKNESDSENKQDDLPLDLSESNLAKADVVTDGDESTQNLDTDTFKMKLKVLKKKTESVGKRRRKRKTVSEKIDSENSATPSKSKKTKPKEDEIESAEEEKLFKFDLGIEATSKPPWQHIKLEEHSDKYSIEKVDSFERRNRGAEVYDIMYVCLICKRFKSVGKEVFEEHLEYHINKDYECNTCGYIGFAHSDMMKHKQACCSVKKGREYVCHLCGTKMISRADKVDHMGSVHGIPELPCRWCKEMFTTRNLRKKHYRMEHTELAQYCNSCHQGLSNLSKSEYKKHIEMCVPGFQCQYCGKIFSRKQGLDSHVTFTHNKVRKHTCVMCPYTASTPEKLKLHVLSHKGIRPFSCDQCLFTCVQPYQLKSHMRTHTGEKPFKCDLCNYAAAWNVQLKEHKKAHSSETAVICIHCSVLFKNMNVLSIHQKKGQCILDNYNGQALTSHQVKPNPQPQVPLQTESASAVEYITLASSVGASLGLAGQSLMSNDHSTPAVTDPCVRSDQLSPQVPMDLASSGQHYVLQQHMYQGNPHIYEHKQL